MVAGSSPAGRTFRDANRLAKRKPLRIFAVHFDGTRFEGHLAQLVQSARLTRERSLVRVQYCPQRQTPHASAGFFVCNKGPQQVRALETKTCKCQVIRSRRPPRFECWGGWSRRSCLGCLQSELQFLLRVLPSLRRARCIPRLRRPWTTCQCPHQLGTL